MLKTDYIRLINNASYGRVVDVRVLMAMMDDEVKPNEADEIIAAAIEKNKELNHITYLN